MPTPLALDLFLDTTGPLSPARYLVSRSSQQSAQTLALVTGDAPVVRLFLLKPSVTVGQPAECLTHSGAITFSLKAAHSDTDALAQTGAFTLVTSEAEGDHYEAILDLNTANMLAKVATLDSGLASFRAFFDVELQAPSNIKRVTYQATANVFLQIYNSGPDPAALPSYPAPKLIALKSDLAAAQGGIVVANDWRNGTWSIGGPEAPFYPFTLTDGLPTSIGYPSLSDPIHGAWMPIPTWADSVTIAGNLSDITTSGIDAYIGFADSSTGQAVELSPGDGGYNPALKVTFGAPFNFTVDRPGSADALVLRVSGASAFASGFASFSLRAQSSRATTNGRGVVELATDSEAIAGTDAERAVTPAALKAALLAGGATVPDATTATKGKVRLATEAEASAGASDSIAVTPRALQFRVDQWADPFSPSYGFLRRASDLEVTGMDFSADTQAAALTLGNLQYGGIDLISDSALLTLGRAVVLQSGQLVLEGGGGAPAGLGWIPGSGWDAIGLYSNDSNEVRVRANPSSRVYINASEYMHAGCGIDVRTNSVSIGGGDPYATPAFRYTEVMGDGYMLIDSATETTVRSAGSLKIISGIESPLLSVMPLPAAVGDWESSLYLFGTVPHLKFGRGGSIYDVELGVNADWSAVSGQAKILNKPTLAAVATSGSYADLTNKPVLNDISGAGTKVTGSDGSVRFGVAAAIGGAGLDSDGLSAFTVGADNLPRYNFRMGGVTYGVPIGGGVGRIITVSGTAYTITQADAGATLVLTNAGVCALTVQDFGLGNWVNIRRAGGAPSFAVSGVTLNWSGWSGLTTVSAGGSVTLSRVTGTTCDITGNMA